VRAACWKNMAEALLITDWIQRIHPSIMSLEIVNGIKLFDGIHWPAVEMASNPT
jgi:hypothetical protein